MRYSFVFVIVVLLCAARSDAKPHAPHALTTSVHVRAYTDSVKTTASNPGYGLQHLNTATNAFVLGNAEYRFSEHWAAGVGYQLISANAAASQAAHGNFAQAYATFSSGSLTARIGNQTYGSPWAYSHPSLGMPPAFFQGLTMSKSWKNWTADAALIDRFDAPSGNGFSRHTLLTSLTPGATTNGFSYVHLGYASQDTTRSIDSSVYRFANLATAQWTSGLFRIARGRMRPTLEAQWGTERSSSDSYAGRIRSDILGAQLSVSPSSSLTVSFGVDDVPWRRDRIRLNPQERCDSTGPRPTYQLSVPGARGSYLLPVGVAECETTGSYTNIYYGGWASPYTDGRTWDPLFTSGALESQVDRRSAGVSNIVAARYFDRLGHVRIDSTLGSFNFSNDIVGQRTREFNTIARLYSGDGRASTYKGYLFTYFFLDVRRSNAKYFDGSPFLGGSPILRANRVQVEYFF